MKVDIICTYYDNHLEFGDKAEYQHFATISSSQEIAQELVEMLNDEQFRDCYFKIKGGLNEHTTEN